MKLKDVAEDKRKQVEKLRKKLCETAIRRAGIREDVCQGCESPFQFGCQLMDLLGLPRPKEPAHVSDVFETVHHSRSNKAQGVIKAMNKWRRR